MPKSKANPHKHPSNRHKNNESPASNIKTGYRIGALVLVAVLIVSMLAMYAI